MRWAGINASDVVASFRGAHCGYRYRRVVRGRGDKGTANAAHRWAAAVDVRIAQLAEIVGRSVRDVVIIVIADIAA